MALRCNWKLGGVFCLNSRMGRLSFSDLVRESKDRHYGNLAEDGEKMARILISRNNLNSSVLHASNTKRFESLMTISEEPSSRSENAP